MLEQYQTLLPQENFQSFGLISTVVGLFLLAYLFMYLYVKCSYQTAYKSKERQLTLEVVVAFLSSGALAVGIFLLALGVGIYM